jgi:threonine dehydratase
MDTLPDPTDVATAAGRIAADIRRTPVIRLHARSLGLGLDAELWLKLEQLQRGGSFKARGMFNRLRAQPVPAAGVVIASGGNAGIAAATAAQALGVRCEVFVPELASEAKRAALRARGAVLVVGGAAYADALAARQARLAAEVEADAGLPDRVLVSVGGGGLLGGLLAQWGGRCRVDALEPVGSPTLHAALAAGEPVDVAVGGLAADALGARRIGGIAWGLVRRHGVASHLVPDAAIAAAQRALWAELRLAVEPAAALPLAALQAGLVLPRPGERVALVICGANLDPATLAG